MTDKSNFSPDEWKLLLESVMMAGMAVSAAEPSGLWGLLKESFASGTALAKVNLAESGNPLIKAVVADFETSEGRSAARDGIKAKLAGASAPEIKKRSIETLSQAAALLDAKAPAAAAATFTSPAPGGACVTLTVVAVDVVAAPWLSTATAVNE